MFTIWKTVCLVEKVWNLSSIILRQPFLVFLIKRETGMIGLEGWQPLLGAYFIVHISCIFGSAMIVLLASFTLKLCAELFQWHVCTFYNLSNVVKPCSR